MKATPQEVPYVPIYDYDGQIASNLQPLTSNLHLLRRRLLGRRVIDIYHKSPCHCEGVRPKQSPTRNGGDCFATLLRNFPSPLPSPQRGEGASPLSLAGRGLG